MDEDKDEDDDYDDDDDEDPFAGGDSSDDPDFLVADMSSDDDDEESVKDSGHESNGAENDADWFSVLLKFLKRIIRKITSSPFAVI